MKPMMIIPVGALSKEDIQRLNDNDICVVEAKDPALVKFVDPIPIVSCRTQIEHAAIQLSRRLLNYTKETWPYRGELGYSDVSKIFVELLLKGTPLDSKPTKEEIEEGIFSETKAEEAHAERAAKKQAAATKPKQ
jgi:hypothetical protein